MDGVWGEVLYTNLTDNTKWIISLEEILLRRRCEIKMLIRVVSLMNYSLLFQYFECIYKNKN